MNIQELKDRARGSWPSLLSQMAPELAEALERPGKHVRCPVHGSASGNNDGFKLFRDFPETGGGCCNTCGPKADGLALISWVRDWTLKKTKNEVARSLMGAEPIQVKHRTPVKRQNHTRDAFFAAKLREAWRNSVGLDNPKALPGRLYLARRGLTTLLPGNAIRFSEKHPCFDLETKQEIGRFPTLLIAFRASDGSPVTLQRIYLQPDGNKAPIAQPKRCMPYPGDRDMRGGAVRLKAVRGRYMGICEGAETGLAIQEATGMPVWATLSNTLIRTVSLPTHVTDVAIWADLDDAGYDSALIARERFLKEGRRAVIMSPGDHLPKAAQFSGMDWLDVYAKFGKTPFPTKAK